LSIGETESFFEGIEIRKLNVSKAFRSIIDTILHDPNADDFTSFKVVLNLRIRQVKREIADMGGERWLRR
jgi:hypothetical protein